MVSYNLFKHACKSQLNNALPEGLLSMLSTSPITGGFGMPSFVGSLPSGSTGIFSRTMSHDILLLTEAFNTDGCGSIAPIYIANDDGRSVKVWQVQGAEQNIGTAEVGNFNKTYKGMYNSHSIGLYPQTYPPPTKGRAKSQGGTIPIS